MATICRKRKIPKKNPTIEEDSSYIPCEIIENILSRLPVKTLLRFKSVSKPWYSLISDPKFARVHLCQSKNSDSKTLLMWSNNFEHEEPFTFLKLINNHKSQIESLEFPLKEYGQVDVVCSCDGLVLLKSPHPSDKTFVLWNPATRTYTKFSCPYTFPSVTYELCYDVSNDDYKVVCINREQELKDFGIDYVVFSCKNNIWIEKKECSLARSLRSSEGLFVNGVLHWVFHGSHKLDSNVIQGCHKKRCNDFKCDYNKTYEICYFDPKDEKFRKLSSPECFDINSVFRLTDLGGELCLYRNTYDKTKVEIWKMKEYGNCNSWMKLMTIENVPVSHNCHIDILYMTKKSDIVLQINGLRILVYSPKENKFCEVHVSGEDKYNTGVVICWNDSLISSGIMDST